MAGPLQYHLKKIQRHFIISFNFQLKTNSSPFKTSWNMGLSIYYSGRLRNPDLISDLITEATDIGDSLHWSITELPSAPGIPVRGIILQPKNCDPLWLTFHANGNLCNPILYSFLLEEEEPKAI